MVGMSNRSFLIVESSKFRIVHRRIVDFSNGRLVYKSHRRKVEWSHCGEVESSNARIVELSIGQTVVRIVLRSSGGFFEYVWCICIVAWRSCKIVVVE